MNLPPPANDRLIRLGRDQHRKLKLIAAARGLTMVHILNNFVDDLFLNFEGEKHYADAKQWR